jgi:hypothetical protein
LSPATARVTLFRKRGPQWQRLVVEPEMLPIEAGGDAHDIDGDGDPDLVLGEDSTGNKVYWWENPSPAFDPNIPWRRRLVKSDGANKHHDQIFGDFDGDGRVELVFWNQGANQLFSAPIPRNATQVDAWIRSRVFASPSESEGLARADIDADGTADVIGGGRWFKSVGNGKLEVEIIDDAQRFTRAAAGPLKRGGRPEVVFVVGDGFGRLKWYEWIDGRWLGHDLVGVDVDHGHTLQIADVNEDGSLDIFCAEMRLDGGNPDAKMWLFLGDGRGSFATTLIATGLDNHESKLADLDGDGDLDIVGKPYNWQTPRLDIWLNGRR